MANDFRKSQSAVKVSADAMAPLFDSGYLYIYDSTMPDGTSAALTTQSQIVRLQFGATAFSTAALGYPVSLSANAITAAASTFSSTATWFRATGNTTTVLLAQGTAGTAGCDMTLNSAQISAGASVSVSSLVMTFPTSS